MRKRLLEHPFRQLRWLLAVGVGLASGVPAGGIAAAPAAASGGVPPALLVVPAGAVVVSGPVAVAAPTATQAAWATAAEIESLNVQALQLDELVAQRVRSGQPVGDEASRRLTQIFGELARFKEIQRRHADGGGEGTGVSKAEADALSDRIAALRLTLRGPQTGPGTRQDETPAPRTEAPEAVPPVEATAVEADPAEGVPGAEPGDVAAAPRAVSVPSGTRLMIRLKGWLSSKDAQAGDRFEAELVDDLDVDGELAVPRGAIFEGYVAEVEPARRPSRGGRLQLEVDRIRHPDGSTTAVSATVVGAKYGDELVGEGADTGSAVRRGILGAILGGLLGGGKGALIGIGIGAGGTLLASEGEDVDLPDGTELRVRFDTSVSVTWGPVRRP